MVLIQLFVITCSIVMVGISLFPLWVSIFYIVVKPVIQPFALLQFKIFGLPIASLPSIFLIIITIMHILFSRNFRISVGHVTILFILLWWSVISLYNSPDLLSSIDGVIKITIGICMMLLVYNSVNDISDIRKILWGVSFSVLFPIIAGFYQAVTGKYDILRDSSVDRVSSVFGVGNAFGIFMSISMIAILMLFFLEREWRNKSILIFLLGCLAVLQVLALNRGTWIALLFGLFVGFVFYKEKIKLRWFFLAIALVAVFLGGQIVNRFEAINHVDESGRVHNTFQGRINYWRTIIPIIMDEPVIGYGIGSSDKITARYLNNEMAPHNDYIRLALEIGIPGALLYIFFLLLELIRNLRKVRFRENWEVNLPMLVLIIYFCIISLTQNIIHNTVNFPLFMAIVGLSMKFNKIYDSKKI